MLEEDERYRELEELPLHGASVLLDYLDPEGFASHHLAKSMKEFLEKVHPIDRHYLKYLREKKKWELENKCYLEYEWPALLPRLLFKLIHMFGYPPLKVGDESTFCYLFGYKGYIVELRDYEGSIHFYLHIPYSLEEEEKEIPLFIIPEKEGEELTEKEEEEILKKLKKEFAENLLRIVMEITPLNYGGVLILL